MTIDHMILAPQVERERQPGHPRSWARGTQAAGQQVGEAGAEENAAEVSATPGRGAVREGVRVREAVLLTLPRGGGDGRGSATTAICTDGFAQNELKDLLRIQGGMNDVADLKQEGEPLVSFFEVIQFVAHESCDENAAGFGKFISRKSPIIRCR